MRRRLPSTGALLAFEAAARFQNFSRAADELAITESAVSKQIAGLEDYLGLSLFYRIKKRVTLSEFGKVYYRQVQEDLNRLERTTLNAMAHQDGKQIIELAVIPTFASKWLIPNLPEFHSAHPDIQINLSEKALPFLFGETIFDAALHYRHPAWAGNKYDRLFDEELVPACSPKLIGNKKISHAVDLSDFPLLLKSAREDSWARWFEIAGCTDLEKIPIKGPRYDLFSMVIDAACAGIGAALVPRLYIQDKLRSGELVIPIDISIRGLKQYCLIYPDHKEVSSAVKLFVEWLLVLARRSEPALDESQAD